MKVIAPGTLYFGSNQSHLNGWHWDAEGRSYADHGQINRDCLKAALLHVASCHGITLITPRAEPAPEPAEVMTLDVERAALDAIALARWRDPS